jgi:ABC-2 type transport system permease protein
MISSLKAELRKIWTVRSTYGILIFSFFLMCVFVFWIEGIKAGDGSKPVTDPYKLASILRDAVTNLVFWGSLVGVLSATYEYRYNTITYTLTAARSRSRALLAKVTAVSVFSIVFTAFVLISTVVLLYLALSIKGFTLAHQVIPADLWWRVFFESWGGAMMGLLIAVLIRQQVGSIAAFFLIPSAVEPLIGLLLKNNQIYLPFIALQQVTGLEGSSLPHTLSHGKAALVVCAYLAVGWFIAWYLFLKRDAN